jgi:hypothetical protein
MAHFLVSDERCCNPVCENAPRPPRGYRFGRVRDKSVRGSLHRIVGTLRRAIEAIVNSKLRRMERELELRGIPTRNSR